MKLSKQTERKLSRFAIHNLTLYLVGGQGIALLLGLGMPGFLGAIQLFPADVMTGQWWRLLTFVFTPPFGNPFFAIFALYLLYFMGGSLEAHWGTFRYNVFVLIGYLMTIAAAFVFPYHGASNAYITGSIFLAFAYLFPDYQILLFFILPVRIKWLALITWLFYAYDFLTGDWATRLLILAAITNFLVFFGQDLYYKARYGHRQMKRQAGAISKRDKPIHTCTVCGITDKTHPTMDFRYCTKCDPPRAYCSEHLFSHEHVREP
ncbi:MAG: rhomboid family intramembrane serine protease [Nevskia sp.]|nr:rhomboid family intramembrane serine protease [Nevskia sp.]